MKTLPRFLSLLSLAGFALISPATAGSTSRPSPPPSDRFIRFSATSLTYLYGFNWDTPFSPTKDRDILTLEHLHSNSIGDLFLFVDFANLTTENRGGPSDTGIDIYGEVSSRISLGKITGNDFSLGLIKDLYIYSGTYEFGRSKTLDNINREFSAGIDTTQLRQLHGVAVDFKVPGFTVATLNAYWRDDLDVSGSTWQLTAAWELPFTLADFDFVFKGFADWCGGEGQLEKQFHTSPQLVVDLGDKLFDKKKTLYFGTEVDIWWNEFGVKNQNDVVPQIILQAYF
jgi:nucleoside-specific outer membrane channel protein Tsx